MMVKCNSFNASVSQRPVSFEIKYNWQEPGPSLCGEPSALHLPCKFVGASVLPTSPDLGTVLPKAVPILGYFLFWFWFSPDNLLSRDMSAVSFMRSTSKRLSLIDHR